MLDELLPRLGLSPSAEVSDRAAALATRAEHSLGDRPGDWRDDEDGVRRMLEGLDAEVAETGYG